MTSLRHLIDLHHLDTQALRLILDHARAVKSARHGLPKGTADETAPLAGKILAMIFDQPSTRTRVSFDVGMRQMGGETLMLSGSELQLGRGETIGDTARVLSRFVDAIMIRTDSHKDMTELAETATIPVINGLSHRSHPCQIMADIMTFEEHRGPIKGRTIAWSGDGNNVVNSWIHAAGQFDFKLNIACPDELRPDGGTLDWAKENKVDVTVTSNPDEAVAGADCVVADVWVSMGDAEASNRHNLLKPFQVNSALMAQAASDALFMHCLPAHRGEEVTAEVMDGPQSVVFDEAENRLHAQKGILAWVFGEI